VAHSGFHHQKILSTLEELYWRMNFFILYKSQPGVSHLTVLYCAFPMQ
jgi:hypothetical protein